MVKIDLHAHGAIDFEPKWLKAQGYTPESLLIDLTETCFDNGLDAFSLISASDPRLNGDFYDRFKHICGLTKRLPKDYTATRLGKNVLVIEKKATGSMEEKRVLIINGMSVKINEQGNELESLVIGSNSVPEGRGIKDTGAYCRDNGLIFIAEHPMSTRSGGIGLKRLGEHLEDYTAVEGHNSQLIFQFPLSFLPVFNQYARKMNERVQKFCKSRNKPWIAVSDSHRFADTGKSYIESPEALNLESDMSVIQGAKTIIEQNKFSPVCNYLSLRDWASWTSVVLRRGFYK